MSLLPVFLKLDGRSGLVVGAGSVALEKIASLLKTGLRLRVVAPDAEPQIRRLATEGRLEWEVLEWNVPAMDFYQRLGARQMAGWTRYRWFEG